MRLVRALMAVAVLALAMPASAAVFVLDFEGIANGAAVGNFYNGGGGPNFGVDFSPDTLALIDRDAGGNGNFGNEPTPSTIMFFLNASNAVMNVAAGFTTGFSFFYTSATAATINVYDGLNGTGTLLASIPLVAQYSTSCIGDPNGSFCNFTPVGVPFAGVAKSIDFGGTAALTGYDNVTFGSDTPIVPEPTTLSLLALAGAGLAARRRLL